MKILIVATLILLACVYPAAAKQSKKIIEYGWDVPDVSYVRDNIAEMEKVPFDGLVIRLNAPKGTSYPREFGWCAFSKQKFNADDWQQAIDDIKSIKFKRFTDNFLQLVAYPADVDWFAPEWSNIAHNSGILAGIAKKSGCKGIMFDPEAYATQLWNYEKFPEEWRKAHTFEEYRAKVKQRGREWIKAINAGYPDIRILSLYGTYGTIWMCNNMAKDGCVFGLLQDFWDGVLEAATPQTIIIDGFESSYGFKDPRKFQNGRRVMLEQAKRGYSDPKAFDKHVRAGFGLWVDWCWKDSWSYTDFTKNYFPPEQFKQSLVYALQTSDEYVWIYSEDLRWWNKRNAPQEYVDALALAKQEVSASKPAAPKEEAKAMNLTPEIKRFGPYRVIGVSCTNKNYASVWTSEKGLLARKSEIKSRTGDGETFGLSRCLPNDGQEYTAAFPVTADCPVPEGMIAMPVADATYAVFAVKGVEQISPGWSAVHAWLDKNDKWQSYCVKDASGVCGCRDHPCFEMYPGDHDKSGMVYIYVPVRPKSP